MKSRKERAIFAVCLTLCLAFSSCAFPAGAFLSRADAIRIAQAKISHDFASSPWNYHRTGVSYLPEDRIWVVSYREGTSGSRCVVEVEDRTGQSRILMP
jgi:hypothetical protein